MKVVRVMKDAVLAPFMVMLIPRTLRRMKDLFRRADDFARRADDFTRRADDFTRRADDFLQRSDALSQRIDDLCRRMQTVEDWIKGEGSDRINARWEEAKAASLAAQGTLKSLEANLRDLAQLRAELQRRTGK